MRDIGRPISRVMPPLTTPRAKGTRYLAGLARIGRLIPSEPHSRSFFVKQQDTSLVLRTCAIDMTSSHGFIWPDVGGIAEAQDWDPNPQCGNGLHGWLYGQGDSDCRHGKDECFVLPEPAKWMVLEVATTDIVDLGGKCKFPRCKVLFAGERKAATDYLIAHDARARNRAVIGADEFVGDDQLALVGGRGRATAGDRGIATAGSDGTAIAGDYGCAKTGDRGTAVAGFKGSAAIGRDHGVAAHHHEDVTPIFGGVAIAGGGGTASADLQGTAIVGDRGIATVGAIGLAIAGADGSATAGYQGTAIAGDLTSIDRNSTGTAAAGIQGTAIAGIGSTAMAGHGGQIHIRYWDADALRVRTKIGYIGEDALEPNILYRLDQQQRFIKAPP